jgi:hypothetical protein
LLLFLALGVGEFEVDSLFLRLFLHVLGKGRPPVALVADLRKADGDREGRRSGDHEAQADGGAAQPLDQVHKLLPFGVST